MKNKEGLALPCLKDYYLSAQLRILFCWGVLHYKARCQGIEENLDFSHLNVRTMWLLLWIFSMSVVFFSSSIRLAGWTSSMTMTMDVVLPFSTLCITTSVMWRNIWCRDGVNVALIQQGRMQDPPLDGALVSTLPQIDGPVRRATAA